MRDLPDYDSPGALKHFLESRGMAMQKKFGQNFLVNRSARVRLVSALGLEPGMTCWEVGPGLGAMTADILKAGARLTAFEIDAGFSRALSGFFGDEPGFSLVQGDVLRTWKGELGVRGIPRRFFGNLPYNIAAAIVGDFISSGVIFEKAVVTVQKEVAARMVAEPDTEDYSSFSVFCQWAYRVTPIMDLSGGSFWPRPNVDSRAVELVGRTDWPGCENPKLFQSVLRALFSSRRKTVHNNFKAWLSAQDGSAPAENSPRNRVMPGADDILASVGIDPGARAETLSLESFLRLSDAVDAVCR